MRIPAAAKSKRCCRVRPTRPRTYNREISGAGRESERSEDHRGDSVRERAGRRKRKRSGLSSTVVHSTGTQMGGTSRPRQAGDGDESGAERRDVQSIVNVGFGRGTRADRRQPRRGTRPRKDRPTQRRQKRAPVQTVLRSKASGDRFPADTTGTMTLATAASRRPRIDGEAKSEEARVRGDAHRLQERSVLRGV
jgi:hypothetical protein